MSSWLGISGTLLYVMGGIIKKRKQRITKYEKHKDKVRRLLAEFKARKRLTFEEERFLFLERRRFLLLKRKVPKKLDAWFDKKTKEVQGILRDKPNLLIVRNKLAELVKEHGPFVLFDVKIVFVPKRKNRNIKFFTLDSYERFVAMRLYIHTKTKLQNEGTFGIAWVTKKGKLRRNLEGEVKWAMIISEGAMS